MRLPVALTLVLLASTPPAAAQPAEAALVERVLDAVRLDRILFSERTQLAGVEWILTSTYAYYYESHIRIDSQVRDAMRPYLDAVPANDLRAALTFLEGSTYDAWTLSEYSRIQYDDSIFVYESWDDVSRADSALTARLLAGLDAHSLTEQMMRRMATDVFASVPAFRAGAEADGLSHTNFLEQQVPNPLDDESGHVLDGLRADLVDLPEADLLGLVAFYESDAGRVVQHAFIAGLIDAVIPLQTEIQVGITAGMLALRGQRVSEAVPPAEIFPEPVGGYDALAARVHERATEVDDDVVQGGLVLVELTVEKDGTPKDLRTPHGTDLALTRVLVEEVLRTRFVPGQTAGRAVRAPRAVAVRFPDRRTERQAQEHVDVIVIVPSSDDESLSLPGSPP